MNNTSPIFDDHLEKGEKIIDKYYEIDGTFSYRVTLISFIIGVVIIILFNKTAFGLAAAAGLFITTFPIINLITKLHYLTKQKGNAITTKKIIMLNNKSIPRYIPFHKIFNMEIAEVLEGKHNSRNVIKIYLEPESSVLADHEKLEISGNPGYILNKLRKSWKNHSPYQNLYHEINQFLKQNELEAISVNHNPKKNIIIERNLNGSRIMINISAPTLPKKLQAEIHCKNEEGNYLLLKNEYIQDKIKKNIGMQDLIIGNKWLDDKFVVQSNYKPFIKFVLNEDGLTKMKDLENGLNLTISMGDKEKMKKANHLHIKEHQTLDEHLLGSVDKRIRIKNKESILRLKSNNLRDIEDYKILGKSLIEKLELLMYLARRINEYNEINAT